MSTGLARFSLIFQFSSVPEEHFVMVPANSLRFLFSRKDNCEKFAHLAYILPKQNKKRIIYTERNKL